MKPIPVSFHLGPTPLVIHTYGIGLAVTFWFAYRYFERRLRSNGYPTDWFSGVFLWIVVASIVGARLLHVVTNLSTYTADPGEIVQVWHGGLSSFGGLLGGVPTGMILARRRCPELPTMRALDIVAPVLMAAWGVGRLLGPQLMVAGGGHPTHEWYGMYYAGQVGKRLPVPIFQAIDSFLILGVLLLIERYYKDRPVGFVLAATMTLWGLTRFYEERLWLGEIGHLGSTLVQVAGLVLFAAGLAVMVVLYRRQRRGASPPGAEDTEDTAPADGILTGAAANGELATPPA
ncbi:MAG TPA: prolipoprotein diacylglyceryl transferase family protein [Acidimicrobiales bacterium]|nr:prolipoprotein diacylglyceryl transferase family protein [Acidimicrobiales bacterium]